MFTFLINFYANLQAAYDKLGIRVVVSLDAAKAIDSIVKVKVCQVPHKFRYGPIFLPDILYCKPVPMSALMAEPQILYHCPDELVRDACFALYYMQY